MLAGVLLLVDQPLEVLRLLDLLRTVPAPHVRHKDVVAVDDTHLSRDR